MKINQPRSLPVRISAVALLAVAAFTVSAGRATADAETRAGLFWQEASLGDDSEQTRDSFDTGADATSGPPEFSASASLGALYQFGADIDGGNNDLSVSRIATALSFETVVTETFTLGISFGYRVSSYDFGGTTGFFAGDPWDDIHTFDAGVIAQIKLDNDWTLFGGPVIQMANESGSDLDDGLTAGAIVGASWKVSDQLVLGGGLGVISQIDDDARFFPVVRLHWQINERLSLTSRSTGQLIAPSFVQLGYDLSDQWHVSIGGGYFFRRFALDDVGPAAGGVGEDEALAFNAGLRWSPSSTVVITAIVGSTFSGQLTAESAAGAVLSEQDYDPALFIGAVGTIRF